MDNNSQSHQPLVSIIIPVYNAEKYIHETISSCINQAYGNLEIIVVNDGSSDGSENVILSFTDVRIKYFKIDNVGACGARNFGIEKATGELIQFLDHDDALDEQKIVNQIPLYLQHGDKYIYSGKMGSLLGGKRSVDEGFELYEKDFTPVSYYNVVLNQFDKFIVTGAWLTPIGLVRSTYGWDARSGINDDGEYFMRIILNSKGIIFSPLSIFYFRRDTPNSLSKIFDKKEVFVKWLYSYTSYVSNFTEKIKTPEGKELAWKALSVYYCQSYPNYPDLLQQCRGQMKQLGYEKPFPNGGSKMVKIANYVGVDAALKLFYTIGKVKKMLK